MKHYLEMNKFITVNAELCSALIVCKRKENTKNKKEHYGYQK